MAKLGTKKQPVILSVQTEKRATEVASICSKYDFYFIVGVEPDKPEDISDLNRILNPCQPKIKTVLVGRNDPCPCKSGKKYKKCCLQKDES
jgi:SWIM/SEC-C metal-binding protein